ncbi:putative integral membrane protein [Acanthocheilonema viteae]
MFWVEEERTPTTGEKDVTKGISQQVVSGDNIESTAVHGRHRRRCFVVLQWLVPKWLQHFLYYCRHSVLSRNSPEDRSVMKRKTPMVANGNLISLQKKKNKVVPFDFKICDRHLELEPLCCLSSCLIRGGCTAVAIFEYAYVVFTLIAIIIRLHNSGLSQLWPPLGMSYNSIVTHTIPLYIILAYDLVIVTIATGLLRALLTFNKQIIRTHLYFDYFALAFNVITLVLFLPPLFLPNFQIRNFANILLILCFVTQIPLQIWAITVLRSCLEFFVLVHVLVELAER